MSISTQLCCIKSFVVGCCIGNKMELIELYLLSSTKQKPLVVGSDPKRIIISKCSYQNKKIEIVSEIFSNYHKICGRYTEIEYSLYTKPSCEIYRQNKEINSFRECCPVSIYCKTPENIIVSNRKNIHQIIDNQLSKNKNSLIESSKQWCR